MRLRRNFIYCATVVAMSVMLFTGCQNASKEKADVKTSSQEQQDEKKVGADIDKEDIVVLYTTDIHSRLNYFGYDGLAAYKKDIQKICGSDRVALVDSGDCMDGSKLSECRSGGAIVDVMNHLDYDAAVPGNHDFKYGVDNTKKLAAQAEFSYICCNLRERGTGQSVLEPYTIVEKGGKKLAFVAVVTPNSTHSYEGSTDFDKSHENIDVNPNPTYDFWEDSFYERIQTVVDETRSVGADYVIVLSHLGYNEVSYSSLELIGKTTGIDAVIDGHAHEEKAFEKVKNADNKDVVFTSAGANLINIGQMMIGKDGKITTKLIRLSDYLKKDAETTDYIKTLE